MFNSYGQSKVGGSDVPLTTFGGVAPEMSVVDLPEGASAGNQDCDYAVAKVYTRAGLLSLFSFSGLTATKFAASGSSVAIPNSSCGDVWSNPNNISLNTPGIYSQVIVNQAPNILVGFGLSAGSTTATGSVASPGTVPVGATISATPNAEIALPYGMVAYTNNGGTGNLPNSSNLATSSQGTFYPVGGPISPFSYIAVPTATPFSEVVTYPANGGLTSYWSSLLQTFAWNPNSTMTVAITSVQVTSNVGTCTCAYNTFIPGTNVKFSGVATATFLNGNTYVVTSQTATTFSFTISHGNYGPTADTGTATWNPFIQHRPGSSGAFGAGNHTTTFTNPVTTGSTVVLGFYAANSFGDSGHITAVSDNFGNSYTIVQTQNFTGNPNPTVTIAYAQNVTGGASFGITAALNSLADGAGFQIIELPGLTSVPGVPGSGLCPNSQILRATAYNFNLPTTVGVTGMQVVVYGHMTTTSGTGTPSLTITPTTPTNASPTFTFVLPSADGPITIATPTTNWGFNLSPAVLNSASLSFDIIAEAPTGTITSFDIYGVEVIANLTPNPPQNFNYIKTFAQQNGTDLTLAIDAQGIGWQENVFANPDVFTAFYLNFEPGSYAKSVTFQEHEYIALSNLTEGVDMPRQYDGVNVDRLSQCGPGVTPSCSGMSSTAGTQAIVQVTLTNVADVPTATVTTQQPIPGLEIGNQFTISGNSLSYWNGTWTVSGTPNAATLSITQTSLLGGVANYTYTLITGTAPTTGSQVTVTGCTNGPTVGGLSVFDLANALVSSATANTFSVLIPGVPDVPPAAESGAATVAGTIFQFIPGTSSPGPAWNQAINGHTTDNTVVWVNVGAAVNWAPNTSWTGVTYAVQNGTNLTSLMWDAPTGCFYVNGSGDGYRAGGHSGNTRPNFNPTPGTFTRGDGEIDWFNIGTPYLNPTQSQFWEANQSLPANILEPYVLEPNANVPLPGGTYNPSNPVYLQMRFNYTSSGVTASETGTGGIITVVGQQATNLGAGLRGVVLLFQTRNGYITGPSPFVQFNTSQGATQITCTNIALGPPDCTARIIAFTAANGSYYYYIPSPVTVISNSQSITYTPTIINDNVTTSATFTFTDAVLTGAGAVEIDVPAYNLFNLIELGNSVGIIDYQGRLFAWGEENKVQNFNNLSFNGGYISNGTAILPLIVNGYVPAGWTQDATHGSGTNLSISPLFGNSFYIKNTTGSTQATYGMITQSAYQDIYNVNILNPNFTYGARVVARCPSQIGSGNLVVDLYSPSFMRSFGSYTIPLSTMTSAMQRFVGNVLTTAFPISVPNDLILRVYATALPNGGDVEVDHLEIYPLQQPVLQNQFRASYAVNPESFDGVTGNCGPSQDNKPIGGAVTLFDNLYCLKTNGGGTYVTSDNGITEPDQWSWKTVSTNIGTMGPNSYDYGENWYLTADRKGLYGYGGGPLEKLSQEIQPVWDMITNYPATVVRNDQYERRILIFACIPTPNAFMPEFPVNADPETPNVCLACNYRENDSLEALISAKPVRQTIMGTVRAFDFVRKWSYWNISSPYAAFCERGDAFADTEQLLICNGVGNSKVYMLSPTQFSDDGVAINSYYITYGFVRPDMQEAKGLGLGEMQLGLGRFLISGSGTLYIADYPDDTQSPDVQWYFPITLSSIGGPTVEAPLNDIGSRFFIRVGTNAVGDHFLLSKMVVTMDPAPWDSVKGIGN